MGGDFRMNWLKFTLRDLFWLIALLSVCAAWWMHAVRQQEELSLLRNELSKVLILETGGYDRRTESFPN